jgi:hypothetical protein
LAAEVVSPGDTFNEVHAKALGWLAAGTAIVLVIEPVARRVTRYRSAADVSVFSAAEAVDCAPAPPGFAPTVAEILDV